MFILRIFSSIVFQSVTVQYFLKNKTDLLSANTETIRHKKVAKVLKKDIFHFLNMDSQNETWHFAFYTEIIYIIMILSNALIYRLFSLNGKKVHIKFYLVNILDHLIMTLIFLQIQTSHSKSKYFFFS